MTTRFPILLALLAGCCPTAPPHVCVEITARTFKVGRIVDDDTFTFWSRVAMCVTAFALIVWWFIMKWREWRKVDRDYSQDMAILRERTKLDHGDGNDTRDHRAGDETATGSTVDDESADSGD